MTASREKTEARKLPMMPIRDMVIFPYMMTPFVVGRESSVRALEFHPIVTRDGFGLRSKTGLMQHRKKKIPRPIAGKGPPGAVGAMRSRSQSQHQHPRLPISKSCLLYTSRCV